MGRVPKSLQAIEAAAPEPPADALYLWEWFNQIAHGLIPNGMAIPSIGWSDLMAWSVFMQIELQPWEAFTLIQLGELRCRVLSEKSAANAGQGKNR